MERAVKLFFWSMLAYADVDSIDDSPHDAADAPYNAPIEDSFRALSTTGTSTKQGIDELLKPLGATTADLAPALASAKQLLGCTKQRVFHGTQAETSALVAWGEECIVVAFRGTSSKTNARYDAMVARTPLPEVPPDWVRAGRGPHLSGRRPLVHSGCESSSKDMRTISAHVRLHSLLLCLCNHTQALQPSRVLLLYAGMLDDSACFRMPSRVCRFLKSLQMDDFGVVVIRHICHLLSSGEVDRSIGTVYVCGHSLGGAMAGLFAGA